MVHESRYGDSLIQYSASLRKLILKALNRNQILILVHARRNIYMSLNAVLDSVSSSNGIPISTLKMNARILADLGLIDYSGSVLRATGSGIRVLSILQTADDLV